MQEFFQQNNISWKESQMHGVIRRLKSRQYWDKRWEEVMRAEPSFRQIIKVVVGSRFYDKLKGENPLMK
jgi:deoxyribodipyrimidine photo-lyase